MVKEVDVARIALNEVIPVEIARIALNQVIHIETAKIAVNEITNVELARIVLKMVKPFKVTTPDVEVASIALIEVVEFL